MSQASELRAIGFNTLADSEAGDGESMLFRGNSIDCVVNYDFQERESRDGMKDFDDRTLSRIEFNQALVETAPVVGEEFIGPDERRHRIEKRPRTTDLTFVCDCVVSTPSSSGSGSSS